MIKKILILGAGYGGVRCALVLDRRLKKEEGTITVINKHNYHQFMTQIHEPAAGNVSYEHVRIPLRDIFENTHVKIIKAEVSEIIPNENRVATTEGFFDYDYLVIALGSEPEYYDIPGLEKNCLTLRSLNSARLIRTHIENMMARFKANPGDKSFLTIVIGGAGFTGVELAGELADRLPDLARNYDIPPENIRLINIEAAPTILQGFDKDLTKLAMETLKSKGVEFYTNTAITRVTENEVFLANGETIPTRTFIWTGGIKANRLIKEAGFSTEERGRAKINKYMQSVDYPNVYIIGDSAFSINEKTREVMGPTAQVAIQGGSTAAKNIIADIRGEGKCEFLPREIGRIASLGKDVAVGKIFKKYKPIGRMAGFLKDLIKVKYLYSLGGPRIIVRYLRK